MAKQEEIKLTVEDVDKAMKDVRKSLESSKVTLEKAVVDKRAQGGETKKEEDYSSGGGRLYKDGKDAGEHPADGGYKSNFADKYPMDKPAAEGEGLEEAIKDSAITKISDKRKRGLTKAVESKSSASSSSKSSKKMKKAVDSSASSSSSKSSKKPVKKAIGEATSSAASSPISDGVSAPKKTGSVKKAVDANGSSNGSATPATSSASDTGSASGAKRLAVKKSLGKYTERAVELVTSAQKHIKKGFDDGNFNDIETAGERLIKAQEKLSKGVKAGEEIPEDILHSIKKSAKYFSKAITAYENENLDNHITAIEKTNKYLGKSLAGFEALQKPEVKKEEKPIAKSVDTSVRFVEEDGKFVMSPMDEETYKKVSKALNEKGLYKSMGDELKDEKKIIEATPLLKSIVDKLAKSHDDMRDALLETKDQEHEFKKSISKSVKAIADMLKETVEQVNELKDTPKIRKSVTTRIPSPLDGGAKENGLSKRDVSNILSKGVGAQLIQPAELLAWDVDKDYVEEIPAHVLDMCERIQSSTKN